MGREVGREGNSRMASSSVRAMMAKAVTTSPAFFSDNNSVQGFKERKDAIRRERKERGATLSQWYGMKKADLGTEERRELELLQFRNFVNPELKHQAPKKSNKEQNEFVEFGFFAGTGRNKRRRLKSFADEWIAENPELEQVVTKRLKRNVRLNRKTKQIVAKKAAKEAARAKAKKASKRSKKGDMLL
ncbi:nucleolus protein required for cell viability [Trypanosoma rangeli]|uniref:Nucleolus protein required for cell viability n=1 Tax=Trypanosoma rangeli TaxID=5698 RepID=A0A3R7RI11_TRYRA|nr:nucleolus protein required for cell viability [Trypanosoma rangeli]RNF02999.1 nucleolus protein required for cell viability [Trypanosoma rangeli]|eukprot:RNF02999.1 nucleolus protein required for cell viability [Trypanosoma rangeli]